MASSIDPTVPTSGNATTASVRANFDAAKTEIEALQAKTENVTTITAYAATLLDDATAADARTTLGLGTVATQAASSVAITGGSITGITDLAVADGGTGASTADVARTNLGLVIGTDVQAYDAGLTDIAGLAVTDGNVIVGNGTNWVAESGSTARTSLGLGSIATQAASAVAITGGTIDGTTIGGSTPAAGTFTTLTLNDALAVSSGGTGATSAPSARNNLNAARADVTAAAGIPPIIDALLTDTAGIPPALAFTRASAGTYYNAFGTLVSAAANLPRLTFDPATGECLGYLSEPGRTNLLTYSQQFDNAAWTKTNATITANDTTAPDGTVTADKLVETATTSTHIVQQTAIISAGSNIAFSLYVKAGERTQVQINLSASGGNLAVVRYNIATGTLLAAPFIAGGSDFTNLAASITAVSNGWRRIVFSLTTAVVTAAIPQIYLYNGGSTYLGDGTSGLFIWGAQLEVGAYASSYMATAASPVARSADTSAQTVTDQWNPLEGTIYVEAITAPGFPALGSSQVLLQYNDGTANNRVFVTRGADGALFAYAVSGGAIQAEINLGVVANSTEIRVAFSFTVNSFTACLNGGTAISDFIGTMPTGITTKRIGNVQSGVQWGGTIRRSTLFPHTVDAATLQSMTQG